MRSVLLATGMTMLLLASSEGLADEKDKLMEKELAKMQGLLGSQHDFSHNNGQQYEARPLEELRKTHRIRGNKWIVLDATGKATGVEKIITLDVSSNPKKLQLTTTRKRSDGKPDETITEYSIYIVDDDGLMVNFGLPDDKGGTKPAPTKFLKYGNAIKGLDGTAIVFARMKE